MSFSLLCACFCLNVAFVIGVVFFFVFECVVLSLCFCFSIVFNCLDLCALCLHKINVNVLLAYCFDKFSVEVAKINFNVLFVSCF